MIEVPAWLIVVVGVGLIAFSLAIYGRLARRLILSGGRVGTDRIAPQDMGLASGMSALFIVFGVAGFLNEARHFRLRDIIIGSLPAIFLVMLIGGTLLYRRVNFTGFFGLRRLGFFKAVGHGLWMVFAAFPIVLAASVLTQFFLHERAEPQEVVKFFLEASRSGNEVKIVVVLLFAVLFAPACEELIFRGYIYPVFKRYLGMWPGIFASAVLFGFIHVNLTSLPALTVLAVCLAIAYEITGSLVVSYAMHATFNLCQLGAILYATFMTK